MYEHIQMIGKPITSTVTKSLTVYTGQEYYINIS
jgi:hypothetical protein